ncbi:hypothetical protein BGI32_01425 [Snodgrassella alvi]|uniref:Yip1 domain-containing protein n=1 Tax=Snodgrassella alvi TaxID=1196083 RepID=A0A2N9WWB4_9NEIS|nr:hypothetical protein [Snodgrassella alvi]PIT18131.1 hypothetical protein BGI32_01425 [Snodgrassella alvi]
MYQFFLDAWAALRLRFYPKTHYHYSPLTTFAVLLALGLINMANISQLLGHQAGITAFILALTVLRWSILSMTIEIILGYYNKQPGQWYGYVLVTEALLLPMIAMLYWPQALATLGSFWLIWTMVVQVSGFVRISQQNVFKVALAYIIYFLITSLAGGMLLFIFSAIGWLDINSMTQTFQQMLTTIPTAETGIH